MQMFYVVAEKNLCQLQVRFKQGGLFIAGQIRLPWNCLGLALPGRGLFFSRPPGLAGRLGLLCHGS